MNITLRGADLSPKDKKTIKKALRDLHNLEIMATNVYRCQITSKIPGLKASLIAAMKNEMGHIEDYLIKLYEYGLKPVWFRWIFWIVGWTIGTYSRIKGKKTILKTGIWTESKAITHYEKLLKNAPWDKETYKVIDKDRQDEVIHLNYWNEQLKKMVNDG